MNHPICDLETGVCTVGSLSEEPAAHAGRVDDVEVIYIGDPMCSWCWGVSPVVEALQRHCSDQGLAFSIVVGGLRPGGGEEWSPRFREFLRHEWSRISELTGQPFHYALLERPAFNYDTEPPCRAVVAARELLVGRDENNGLLQRYFSAIQRKFYVDNEDPAQPEFYRGIGEPYGMDFDEFLAVFDSQAIRIKTFNDFRLNREWSVRGYPSFVLRQQNKIVHLGSGYCSLQSLIDAIAAAMSPSGE